MDEPEAQVYRLRHRTPQEQIDWLINQVSFLVARVGTLERQVDELTGQSSGSGS